MSNGEVRPVYFTPWPGRSDAVELTTLRRMRQRGGASEFLTAQRLDFDVVLRIDSGSAEHTVDFATHELTAGDVLWIRAGQVHRWGAIDDIEGDVALLASHAVDSRTRELVSGTGSDKRTHWGDDLLVGTPFEEAWRLLVLLGQRQPPDDGPDLGSASLEHVLAATLLELTATDPAGAPPGPVHSHEAYRWFRDEIDRRFDTWHRVGQYADRLGYSTRTLNRMARDHTGLTAKQLIDERVVLEAKRLLSHGHSPVADIAARLGFDDPSNFSTYFQRRTGLTPGTFRRRHS